MDDAFGKRSKRKGGDFGEEYRAKVSHCIEVFFTFVFNQFDYFLLFNLNFQKAGGDIKKKGKPDPYAYVPLNTQTLNKR